MFYKAVKKDLTSLVGYAKYFKCIVTYKFGKWVQPEYQEAPLFVFSEDPRNLPLWFNGEERIFECAIIESYRKWVLSPDVKTFQVNLQKAKEGSRNFIDHQKFPPNTVLADQVMLTKEITNRDTPPQIFYKILPKDLVSLSVESRSGDLDIQYKINEWVTPKSHLFPLMVFDSYVNAHNFCGESSMIYQCEIVQSKQKWGYVHSCDMYNAKRAKTNKKKFSHWLDVGYQCPTGTVFADAVKIIGLHNDRI